MARWLKSIGVRHLGSGRSPTLRGGVTAKWFQSIAGSKLGARIATALSIGTIRDSKASGTHAIFIAIETVDVSIWRSSSKTGGISGNSVGVWTITKAP